MPAVIAMALGIYLFRDLIITILFTKSFMPMRELFFFQLIGDVIKIASWLFGYIMLAKAMTRLYIVSEILFTISFVVLAVLFVNIYGLIGVTIAFMLNYTLYLIVLYFRLKGFIYDK